MLPIKNVFFPHFIILSDSIWSPSASSSDHGLYFESLFYLFLYTNPSWNMIYLLLKQLYQGVKEHYSNNWIFLEFSRIQLVMPNVYILFRFWVITASLGSSLTHQPTFIFNNLYFPVIISHITLTFYFRTLERLAQPQSCTWASCLNSPETIYQPSLESVLLELRAGKQWWEPGASIFVLAQGPENMKDKSAHSSLLKSDI